MGEIILSYVQSYYVATLTKGLWCWQREKPIKKWNRTETPEIDPHSYN